MRIESNELRQEIKNLFCEMGWINKESVLKIINELEEKAKKDSEFYQILEKL